MFYLVQFINLFGYSRFIINLFTTRKYIVKFSQIV
jgi:hypothetical protein